jgi:hypothetical protein
MEFTQVARTSKEGQTRICADCVGNLHAPVKVSRGSPSKPSKDIGETMKRHLALLALAAAALPGCVVYDHGASATFQWDVSSCDALGIDTVSVDIYPQNGGSDIFADAPCGWGALTFDGIDADTYTVAIDAVAAPRVPVVSVDDSVSVYPGDNVFSYRFLR